MLAPSSWTWLEKQRQGLEATHACDFAQVGIRKTEHSWLETRDPGRWFGLLCFSVVGDTEHRVPAGESEPGESGAVEESECV